jgi:glycerol kinase
MGSIFKFSPIHCTPRLMWAMKNVEGAQELAAQGKLLFGTTDTWILWNLTGAFEMTSSFFFFIIIITIIITCECR